MYYATCCGIKWWWNMYIKNSICTYTLMAWEHLCNFNSSHLSTTLAGKLCYHTESNVTWISFTIHCIYNKSLDQLTANIFIRHLAMSVVLEGSSVFCLTSSSSSFPFSEETSQSGTCSGRVIITGRGCKEGWSAPLHNMHLHMYTFVYGEWEPHSSAHGTNLLCRFTSTV